MIEIWIEKLVDKITMSAMNLYLIEACLASKVDRFAKLLC